MTKWPGFKMALVVRKMAKYGGTCLASAFAAGKFLGPLIGQLQKIKTEEIITNERSDSSIWKN